MNHNRSIRTYIILVLMGMFVIGLTSCKLPASQGPQSTSETFPIPGGSEPTSGGIDVSSFATQTAQVLPPETVASPTSPESSGYNPIPTATVPVAPTATATEIVYVEPTQGPLPATYTLEEGEYPFCIARRFDVSMEELMSINDLTADSFYYAGEELKIPQTGNPFEGDRSLHDHPTTYKIQSGDTVNSIACYFGDVSPEMIIQQNNLHSTDLPVGETLIIP